MTLTIGSSYLNLYQLIRYTYDGWILAQYCLTDGVHCQLTQRCIDLDSMTIITKVTSTGEIGAGDVHASVLRRHRELAQAHHLGITVTPCHYA